MSFCIGFLCGVICCILIDVRQNFLRKQEETTKQTEITADEVKQKENEDKAKQFEKLMAYEPYSMRRNRTKAGGK